MSSIENNDTIKVLMMGARRAGKTSALLGLYTLLQNDALKSIINIKDVTSESNAVVKLKKKREDVRKIIKGKTGKIIMTEGERTDAFLNYTFEISIPGATGSLKMTFTDANGEYYANNDIHAEQVIEKIANYDIIIVAIDTPYLMEMDNPDNKLCTPSVGKAYNQIDNVHNLLINIDDEDGKNAKLVCFVPIKCERWARHGEIDNVTKAVEKAYKTTIQALCSYSSIEVVILPMQTMGCVEFESHRESLVLNSKRKKGVKCSPTLSSPQEFLLPDGSTHRLLEGDSVVDDPDAIIEGFGIRRPNSWFIVTSEKYEPHNCDQLAYYILQFSLSKALDYKKAKDASRSRWWRIPVAALLAATGFGIPAAALLAYHFIEKRMGTINLKKLQSAIDAIKAKGIWKTSSEGIKILTEPNKSIIDHSNPKQ